jgi:hypothetical protein
MKSNWQEGLKIWRRDRNITEPSGKVAEMLNEELDELKVAIIEKDNYETIDALCDLIVLATNELELMGYDLDTVMIETVKEISSRRQCPIQKIEWDEGSISGKWTKDRSQTDTYKARYV